MDKRQRKDPAPVLTGGIDELRAAAGFSRQTNAPVLFVLTSPADVPVAVNILQDSTFKATVTTTLLITPLPIPDEPQTELDAIADELEDDVDVKITPIDLQPKKKPGPKPKSATAEMRRQKRLRYMREYAQRWRDRRKAERLKES